MSVFIKCVFLNCRYFGTWVGGRRKCRHDPSCHPHISMKYGSAITRPRPTQVYRTERTKHMRQAKDPPTPSLRSPHFNTNPASRTFLAILSFGLKHQGL